ncbi:MAG: hypothetical protein WCG42_02485, partial [Parachlamydiaceae bacterium]
LKPKIQSLLRSDDLKSIDFFSLTWVHGSNSAILPNLPPTDMQLIPTGRLLKIGVTPLSGELEAGIGVNGINKYKISGTSLNDAQQAIRYADNSSFHTTVEGERGKIEEFITQKMEIIKKGESFFKINSTNDITCATSYSMISFSIKRLRLFDETSFEKLQADLIPIITKMERDYTIYTKSNDYKSLMPRSEDPTGKLGYKYKDKCWFEYLKDIEKAIEMLKTAIEAPSFRPEGIKEAIKDKFPIIFGSRTLHPIPLTTLRCGHIHCESERPSTKAIKIGKDAQYIFVNAENIATIEKYIEEQGLTESVQIVDNTYLNEAMTLNTLAAPYFYDIASNFSTKGF